MNLDLPKLYVAINAVLYIVFGVLCTIKGTAAARGLGYLDLSNAGQSEFLVVYGGLQLGMGVFFAAAAWWRPVHIPAAVLVTLALYIPIVLFRWSTILALQVREPMTLAVGSLETLLLIGAVLAWNQSR